jgi:hypothetical protein
MAGNNAVVVVVSVFVSTIILFVALTTVVTNTAMQMRGALDDLSADLQQRVDTSIKADLLSLRQHMNTVDEQQTVCVVCVCVCGCCACSVYVCGRVGGRGWLPARVNRCAPWIWAADVARVAVEAGDGRGSVWRMRCVRPVASWCVAAARAESSSTHTPPCGFVLGAVCSLRARASRCQTVSSVPRRLTGGLAKIDAVVSLLNQVNQSISGSISRSSSDSNGSTAVANMDQTQQLDLLQQAQQQLQQLEQTQQQMQLLQQTQQQIQHLLQSQQEQQQVADAYTKEEMQNIGDMLTELRAGFAQCVCCVEHVWRVCVCVSVRLRVGADHNHA